MTYIISTLLTHTYPKKNVNSALNNTVDNCVKIAGHVQQVNLQFDQVSRIEVTFDVASSAA